jgi:hypothetical protein
VIELFSPISRGVKRLGPKRLFGLVLLGAAMLLIGFYLGRYTVYEGVQIAPEAMRAARVQLSELRETLDVAVGELQMLRTQHDIDSRALEMLRSEMAAEKELTADIEEGLSFYRSMVVSEDLEDGLHLRQPELVPGDSQGQFSFRFFVQQLERDYEIVEGVLSVDVIGTSGEEEVIYPLAELSEEFAGAGIALHFRYFQAIEGELILPTGFIPSGMILVARTSKPREREVREQYPWELQERFINVGP